MAHRLGLDPVDVATIRRRGRQSRWHHVRACRIWRRVCCGQEARTRSRRVSREIVVGSSKGCDSKISKVLPATRWHRSKILTGVKFLRLNDSHVGLNVVVAGTKVVPTSKARAHKANHEKRCRKAAQNNL